MAQSTAGTNLVNNWHANTAQPTALVEVCWDGTQWTDETGNVASLDIQHALYDVVSGLPLMGQTQPSRARVVLCNNDDRYTPDNGSSPLYSHITGGPSSQKSAAASTASTWAMWM